MYDLGESFKNEHPENLKAFSKSIFKGAKYRITVQTERLLRDLMILQQHIRK